MDTVNVVKCGRCVIVTPRESEREADILIFVNAVSFFFTNTRLRLQPSASGRVLIINILYSISQVEGILLLLKPNPII